MVVLHLATPPPPAHPGRPAGIPPAATTAAAANDPAFLAASRAAAAADAPRPAAIVPVTLPVPTAYRQRDPPTVEAATVVLPDRGRSGSLPATALQDPAGSPRRQPPLKVVTERRASGRGAALPTLQLAFGGGSAAAAQDFRTDSAYTHDLRCYVHARYHV